MPLDIRCKSKMSKIKKKKSKQLRIDSELFHILKSVSVNDERWSRTARKYLWKYCIACHKDVVDEIDRQYAVADEILKNNDIAKEIIKNESSNL